MEVKGFTALQAAELIHQVLAQHNINIAVNRIEQQAQLELSSEDALLSLRTVGSLCDKLALQVNQPKLHIIKSYCR
jgi:hypothetical protein